MRRFYQTVLLTLPLVACGGGGGSNSGQPVTAAPDYSKLSQAQLKPAPLREASTNELGLLIKNGFRVSLREYTDLSLMMRNNVVPGGNEDAAEGSGNFSGTNVQVDGVDEADHVKYDGNYIYLATPVDYSGETPTASLKIFSTDPATASVSEVSDTAIDASYWGDISELYLVNDEEGTTGLASIRRSWNVMYLIEPMDADRAAMSIFSPWQMDTGINIGLYDVRNPTTPNKTWSLTIDGDLLGSRKIGNMLYIISSFVPRIDDLNYAAQTKEEKIANETHIASTNVEKLLPEYTINDGSPQPLNSSNSCLVPNTTTSNQGYLSLVNITAVNLSTQQLVESVCINTNIQGIYASTDNLYLGASDTTTWENWDEFTVVHKFALNDQGVDYRATGSVEGYLGWSSPSFRMDENNDYLRVITTRYEEDGAPVHKLNVLHETNDSQELALVAQLPNETHPETIGKPREDIYAVRFYGDKAYVVTFERQDPLYVLDLANPTAPQIAGELELPGFSTYLHPVGDNYLFSFGYETDEAGVQTGIKAALFDISNMSNPVLVNQHLLGDNFSTSEALYDHRAFSFLQASDDQLRITLPIMEYISTSVGEEDLWSFDLQSSLQLFEINGLTGDTASLDLVGEISADAIAQEDFNWYGNDRGLLHDDSVFYVHGPWVMGSPWSQN
jgi:hypothetical protein